MRVDIDGHVRTVWAVVALNMTSVQISMPMTMSPMRAIENPRPNIGTGLPLLSTRDLIARRWREA